ncbi:MAG: copper amine oxidase N-terminal domain-containing protein [Defluviitaleaceae bacterium]|nr:copper amine oxidase N-terminal domain-containing protein [Defluviitaleaceae bacterium]
MKQLFRSSIVMALAMILSISPINLYANPVRVEVDGALVTFDVEPFVQDGRTMVPLRAIAEILGINVYWDGEMQEAWYINHDNVRFTLPIGSEQVRLNCTENGLSEVEIDAPPLIVDGRTFVPLRFIAESLNVSVDFVEGKVIILTNQSALVQLEPTITPATQYDMPITAPATTQEPVQAPQTTPTPTPSLGVDLTRTVWIAGTGGTIYHSVNNCGNMNPNRATSITRQQAHARGLRACLRCW